MRSVSLIAAALAIFIHSTTANPGLIDVYCATLGKLTHDSKCKSMEKPESPKPVEKNATEIYGDHPGSSSSHPDGSGTLVRTDDYYKWDNGKECWTDLYYISSSENRTQWVPRAEIDCGRNSSNCVAGISDGMQTCNNWSLGVEAGVGVGILARIFEVSGSVTVTDEWSECEELKTELNCEWKDQKCHAIWSRYSQKTDYGYIRRRCTVESAGVETVWSKDWDIAEKGKALALGCEASCDAKTYPDP